MFLRTVLIRILKKIVIALFCCATHTADYKWARGFDPVLIHSVHYICHPVLRRAIGQFFLDETEGNLELTKYLRERSAIAGRVPTK